MAINPEEWFGKTAQDPSRVRTKWVEITDPGMREMLGVPEGGMPLDEFLGISQAAAAAPAAPSATPGFFTSVKRGGLTTAADYANFMQLVGEIFKAPEMAAYWSGKNEEWQKASEKLPRQVPRIEDVHGLGDAGMWAIETIGEQVPVLASFIVPGGLAAKGVGLIPKVAQATGALAKAPAVAGWTAGLMSDIAMMTGESAGIAKEHGEPIVNARVIGTGLGKAALDFIPFFTVAKQLGLSKIFEGKIIEHAIEAGYLKRAAQNAAVILATEVPTETMQEWINNELDNYFTGYEGPITEEQKSRLYNAAAGAALFGAFGLYAPKPPPPPGITPEAPKEGETPKAELPIETTTPLLTTDQTGAFRNVPLSADPNAISGFDFRNLYDPKTGELRTTAQDFMRIVHEQAQFTYDPTTDQVKIPPSSATYSTIVAGWQEKDGTWYLDAPQSNLDAAKAQVIPGPEGFSAWDVYGNSLGVYPDLTSAMSSTANAVNGQGRIYAFDRDGMHVIGEQDEHSKFVQTIQIPQTPVEHAAVAIEQAKPQRAASETRGNEAQISEIVNDPELMKLIDARNEFVNDKDNYRSTDGEMKKDAAKRLVAMDARIQRFAEIKGLRPAVPDIVPIPEGDMEKFLGDETNAEQRKADAPKFANLNPFESKMYEKLAEKEMFEGLTPQEYEELVRLKQKTETGTDLYGEYVLPPEDKMKEFSDMEKELIRKIQKRRRFSKATREILKMRGVQPAAAPGSQGTLEGWRDLKGTILDGAMSVDGYDIAYLRPDLDAAIGKSGKFYALFKEKDQQFYFLGQFRSAEAAARVAEGASPDFVHETVMALSEVWKTFRTRPKLIILSTSDILNGKGMLTENDKRALLESAGTFKQGKPGTVYIHVDQHHTVEETVSTLVHEMFGHFGLRAVLPKPFWDAFLYSYAQMHRERIKYTEKMGLSPEGSIARELGDNRLADILTADEMVSYLAQESYSGNPLKPFEQGFLDRTVALVKKWMRWIAYNIVPESWRAGVMKALPVRDKDVIKMLRDVAAAMRQPSSIPIDTRYVTRSIMQPSKGRQTLTGSIDSFSDVWGVKTAGLFLQALQYAEKYNIPHVADYVETVQKWAARKSSLQNRPVELVNEWQLYSKNKSNRLAEALLYMTGESDRLERALTPEERKKILNEHGVDEEGQSIYEKIRQSFMDLLDMLENGLIRQEIRRHVPSAEATQVLLDAYNKDKANNWSTSAFSDALTADLQNLNLAGKLNQIHSQINSLRNRDYFPYMRFGRYAIWVRAKQEAVIGGKKYRGPTNKARGQMVHFETYETYHEMKKAAAAIEKEYSDHPVEMGTGWVSDQEYTMLGMPPALYDTLQTQLELSKAQLETLKEIYYTKSPGQRFLASMVKRKGVKGFSTDALRVYASYMLNAASHIARIEHGQDLDAHITEIGKFAGESKSLVAGHVSDYWKKHYKYIMNPENDWAGLRAVGFLWYLGFNVKSAAVNMTQVPMVALPYLGARFGDAKAAAALTKAYKDAFKMMKAKSLPDAELDAAIKQGIADGFLDESLATILAGFSESSVLQRIMPETDAQRRLNQVAWAGSFMFRHVEQLNRYVTFIATRRLAMESNGGNTEAAYKEAKEAIQASMFEYAKWNRAEYMRGKKSVFFLFWSYMQGLAYLMGGGKGKKTALRVWMMMLLAGGLQGIPFAENILDLFDWSSRELKEALGYDNPYQDTRTELRKLAQTITDSPDMLLHGWSRHYGLGPLHLLALAGVPVPEVDISGSISAGRWLPGTDKALGLERDPDKKFGQTLVDVLGPVAGMGYGLFSALTDQHPDDWKKWERAMPSAIKAASQSVRRRERGEEEFRQGGAIVEFDPANAEDRTALWMNMLGFQPTQVGQAYEVIGAKENVRRYWTGRHAMVMENWAFAKRSGDPELMADARDALREFNEQVPDPKLRLTPEKIRLSMKARQRKLKEREMGLPSEKGYRRLYEEIDQIYGLR